MVSLAVATPCRLQLRTGLISSTSKLLGLCNTWVITEISCIKGKVDPRIGRECPEGEKYSSTISLTSALDWGVWLTPRLCHFPSGKKTSTYRTGGWVAPGQFWTGAENLNPTGIPFPVRPARSESLYRLSYPGPRSHAWYPFRPYFMDHV